MLSLITASGLPGQIAAALRNAFVRTVLTLCAAFLLAAAAAFAAAALYDWLSIGMPSHLAALSMAAVLAIIGTAFLLATRLYRRSAKLGVTREFTGAQASEGLLTEIERRPSASIIAAVALGVIVGLLCPGRPR